MPDSPDAEDLPEGPPEDPPAGATADVRVLRAIAHPVRNRVLAELSAAGPLRAADIAARISIPANQASFHLRQLAKYGLVEEAPELARDGRDRVWREVKGDTDIQLGTLEQEPGNKAAVGVFRRRMAERLKGFVDAAFSREHRKGTQVTVVEDSLALTQDEAARFARELTELTQRWNDETKDRKGADRRTYHVLQVLQPYPEQDG